MTGKDFVRYIVSRYSFRKTAADLVIERCDFRLYDEASINGGGRVYFAGIYRDGAPLQRTLVEFDTSQAEAGVHELAHAWWFEIGRDYAQLDKHELVAQLLDAFLTEANATQDQYTRIRELCHEFRYGWEGQPEGMWWGEPLNRWNHDEIYASLASATMGDLRMYPPSLRPVYDKMFDGREYVHLPAVHG